MEIMTINTNELANKNLVKGLTKLNKLASGMRKGQKDFALELGRIAYNELYVEDFENLDGFCEFLGMSKSTVSQAKKYYEIREQYKEDDKQFEKNHVELFDSFSFSQIVETFKVYNFFGFIQHLCFLEQINVEMSAKEIRALAKQTIEDVKDELNDYSEETETESTEEETEEVEESEVEVIDGVIESALNCVSIMINERFNGDKKKALEYLEKNL